MDFAIWLGLQIVELFCEGSCFGLFRRGADALPRAARRASAASALLMTKFESRVADEYEIDLFDRPPCQAPQISILSGPCNVTRLTRDTEPAYILGGKTNLIHPA